MARAGMSDEEMTAFLKEMFCVDSTFTAAALFNAAELPPSWQTVCTKLGLNTGGNTYLPTLRAFPTVRGRTYLPTPRAYLSSGPTYYEKT